MGAHAQPMSHADHGSSLNRVAALATLHCLTGCAIGEVLGMVIGTALGFSNPATIALAVFLAFVFGYALTMLPLVRSGLSVAVALPLAFAADSFSIAVMELVDNGVMLAIPGAMDAPLTNPLFWSSLGVALAVAYVVALPVNRYLIARGQGHSVVHQFHGSGDETGEPAAESAHDVPRISARRLVALGVAAMSLTIGVATGGALLVESHGGTSDEHGPVEPDRSGGHGDGAGGGPGLGGLPVARGNHSLVVPR